MINDFVRIFRKSEDEFKNYENKEEIIRIIFYIKDNELYDRVLEEIKLDFRKNGYIFKNLVSLLPFTEEIVEYVLENKALDELKAYRLIESVWEVNSKIKEYLQQYKLLIRRQLSKSNLELDLEDIEKEILKKKEVLRTLETLKQKEKELSKLYSIKADDIEKLKEKIKYLEKELKEFDDLKAEFNKSRKIFKPLIEDES